MIANSSGNRRVRSGAHPIAMPDSYGQWWFEPQRDGKRSRNCVPQRDGRRSWNFVPCSPLVPCIVALTLSACAPPEAMPTDGGSGGTTEPGTEATAVASVDSGAPIDGSTGAAEPDPQPSSDGGEDPPPPQPPATCGPSPLLQAADSLLPGEWVELPTDGLTAELTDAGDGHWITQYTFEAMFDPTWCRVLFIGGGHLSLQKFISYDIASNSWQREPNPSWWCDPFEDGADVWACSDHAYGHNAIDVAGQRYFYKRGDVFQTTLQSPVTSDWAALPDLPVEALFTSLSYFPEMSALFLVDYENQGIGLLPDGADAWQMVPGPFPMGAYHSYAVHDPVHHRVLFGGGNGSGELSALYADGRVDTLPTAPRTFHPEPDDDSTFKILTVDPTQGNVLAYAPNGDLFALDSGHDRGWFETRTTLPAGLELAVTIPDYGVVMFVDGRDQRVVVYRH